MRTSPWLMLALSAVSMAFPTPTTQIEKRDISSAIRDYFAAVGKHIEQIRRMPTSSAPPTCDLDKLALPTTAPSPLPAPGDGLKVVHVAVGRGVQNYTCADSSSATVPVSIGAVASLYNATCTGSNYPDLLSMMPNVAVQFPVPAVNRQLSPPNLLLSGHHYFTDMTTPTFNMDTAPDRDYGMFSGKKNATAPAPATAIKGDAPQGSKAGTSGFGSVAWLKLVDKTGAPKGIKEVYRVNTAGGNPPPTCAGMPLAFSVDYAAEYWFFN